MSRVLKILAVLIVLALLLIAVTVKFVIPSQLKKQITSQIEENCKTCEFSSDGVELKLFPTRVIFDAVHFMTGDPKSTLIEAQVDRASVTLSVKMLLSQVVKIEQVVVEKPVVTVTEGDQKAKHSPGDETPSKWSFEIDRVELRDGQFTYKREHLGKLGILPISNINGEIGKLGSTPARRDELVTGQVTALLEQSGKIDLTLIALLFSKNNHVDLSIVLKGLNLTETNSYFGPDDGITLKGFITEGDSSVSIRGNLSQAKVDVDYEKLSLKVRKTADRSELAAVFTNLFSGVKKAKDRSRSATSKRKPEEPLVGFILRGMKEAALKVATD